MYIDVLSYMHTCMDVCMYAMCMPGYWGVEKRTLDLPPGTGITDSCKSSSGNGTQVPRKRPVFLATEPSLWPESQVLSQLLFCCGDRLKHHDQRQLTEENISLGLWFHRNKSPLPLWWVSVAAGRHGSRTRKLRLHILNHNLKAENSLEVTQGFWKFKAHPSETARPHLLPDSAPLRINYLNGWTYGGGRYSHSNHHTTSTFWSWNKKLFISETQLMPR